MDQHDLSRLYWEPSTRRILLVGLLAHYAASCSFCVMISLLGFLNDLKVEGIKLLVGVSWSRAFEILYTAPLVTAVVGLCGAVVTGLSLGLTLPVSVLVVRTLNIGPFSAIAIGFLPIPTVAIGVSFLDGGPGISEWDGLASAGTSGGAFAWVVWALCIRPRRSIGLGKR